MLACLPLALYAFDASAQFGGLLDRVQRRAEDAAVDSAERAARDAAKGEKKPAQPKAKERKAPAEESAQEEQRAEAPRGQAAPAAAPAAGEVYGNRFDFVPGDKVLVYDDFSDTDVGEYPAKWTIKDGGGNQIEVVEAGKRRFLKTRYSEHDQDRAVTWLRYGIKGDMPKNFTIEFDMDVAGPMGVLFSKVTNWGGQEIRFHPRDDQQVRSTHAHGKLPVKTGIQHVAIAVSGTQAKVYVAGERVLSDPDAVVRPITRLGIHFHQPYQKEGDHQMFTNLRIAEGGKPAKQMLAGEGKIITHGIQFDTASDVIKPESGPTLRMILALLNEDPALGFSIEGHTDDQGGPKINGPLSERRAAAVKTWLVKQGIEEKRLTTRGLGQSKPIDDNATAEGRANNRRVEFVRTSGASS
jgi:outer membrane protein OmpA-like peptidoglycan-associated protein